MRELLGVLGLEIGDVGHLKAHALVFDKFRFFSYSPVRDHPYVTHESQLADFSFLLERGVLEFSNEDFLRGWKEQDEMNRQLASLDEVVKAMAEPKDRTLLMHYGNDLFSRMLAAHIGNSATSLVVPICRGDLPIDTRSDLITSLETVYKVALEAFPIPGEDAAWQDIIDFREESRDKLWGFRRFLRDLAGKKQSEVEIKDDIEWSANEYAKSMQRFKLKQRRGLITTVVVPLAEAADKLINPIGLINGLVSISQSKVALLEAEANAKGRECAYIHDAQQTFGA
jgi:hypothetical protein